MSCSTHTSRPTRFAVLAVAAATALSVAACGSSSNKAGPTTSPSATQSSAPSTSTTAAPPPAHGQARISGLIASVSGNAAQVTQENGNATVDFTPSTKVTDVTPAALTDVAAGSCVTVRATETQGNQPVTAAAVRISQAVDGKCPQAKQPAPGSPAKRPAITGTVASVAGNTINVTSNDNTQTPVTVNDKTRYTKQNAATAQAITVGKCLTAQGTQDNGGALQATAINLRPANDGKCGPSGKPHGHGG
ncbi:DUF5666 domain-containing protein [Mycobacterium sp. 1423905.2]|uniref:DUF5666 domain-containing protein n=1 Tax=Mycobacterium sp. 1423905.2 TaxID=1856859 RepID=UPI0007FF01CE|nr:DUF5666 domain-containing protein [Mycobacterium sp. 1423905.2]OBJ61623.1 hypothetical protein A9W95_09350 [Mycobacterium sp. 1423905.2]